jgi:hypothetical protein
MKHTARGNEEGMLFSLPFPVSPPETQTCPLLLSHQKTTTPTNLCEIWLPIRVGYGPCPCGPKVSGLPNPTPFARVGTKFPGLPSSPLVHVGTRFPGPPPQPLPLPLPVGYSFHSVSDMAPVRVGTRFPGFSIFPPGMLLLLPRLLLPFPLLRRLRPD